MAGSMKGERRGAAARRRRKTVPHETPDEVISWAKKKKGHQIGPMTRTIERRIEVARIIHGVTGLAADMLPKEMMLDNAQYFHQAALDWQRMLEHYASILPPTKESTEMAVLADQRVKEYRLLSHDCNYRAGSFFHAKKISVKTSDDAEANQGSIVRDLLDDIDERARNARLINPPIKKVAG